MQIEDAGTEVGKNGNMGTKKKKLVHSWSVKFAVVVFVFFLGVLSSNRDFFFLQSSFVEFNIRQVIHRFTNSKTILFSAL
jgi:hypothetical protein